MKRKLDDWVRMANRCEICGKILYPSPLYGWKIAYKAKTLYACSYTCFRKLEEKINQTKKANYGNGANPIIEMSPEGEVIEEYKSITLAAEIAGLHRSTMQRYLRSAGEYTLYDGRRFIYKKDYERRKNSAPIISNDRGGRGHGVAVLAINKAGEIIEKYMSIGSAAAAYDIDKTTLWRRMLQYTSCSVGGGVRLVKEIDFPEQKEKN